MPFSWKSNKSQAARQSLMNPVLQVGEHSYLDHRDCALTVLPRYSVLDNLITTRDNYAYIIFDENSHITSPFKHRKDRYDFIEQLRLSVPIDVLRYHPVSSMDATVVLWRTSAQRNSDEILKMSIKVFETVKPLLPEYHTRQMKQTFINTYCKLSASSQSTLSPAILRSIYSYFSLDASADQNKTMDERIRQAILSEDADLVTDLRHLNTGRPNDTFKVFFEKLSRKVEEITAVDDRRHNIEHLSHFISIKDLIKQVKDDLPADTPIPSEITVLFSFVPKNAYTKASRLYKSTIPLKYKIQTRQLRNSHQDEHYCAAIFKNMRLYAIKFKDYVNLLCVDNKAKVDFGEPGLAVASGVRGKQSIVPVNSLLSTMDHDFCSKGSLTPSVCLKVQIPKTIEESFYRGTVTVSYEDSTFQASNPWRHAYEMEQIIRNNNNETIAPVLMIYSDGGPDHRVTYHAVKLALIVLFKKLDLDMLIAGRTAPGHSW